MAGNTRGRLKERFEGIHKNFEWAKNHLAQSSILIKDHHPHLKGAIESLAGAIDTLDELAMDIYARL